MSAVRERFTLATNLLVYAMDSTAGVRHQLACDIVRRAVRLDCWLTLKAVSEFYAATSRKGIVSLADAAAQAADWLELFPCARASSNWVCAARSDPAAAGALYWSALLPAQAGVAGCPPIR